MTLLTCVSWLQALSFLLPLSLPLALKAQTPASQAANASRPKNAVVMVIGYEMDKARSDAILQTQNVSADAKNVVAKLEKLVATGAAKHVSCAATVMRSGMRLTLDTGTVSIKFEGTISKQADGVAVSMLRKVKASGVETVVNASMDTQGTPIFIGSVPDASPGKDQLLFMRCAVHFLD